MKREEQEKYKCLEKTVLDDRYLLEQLIGMGGMAVVFKATDMQINNNTVAIKMLKEEVASNEVMVKRLQKESEAELQLRHPNIVNIDSINVKGDIKYIVMEYVNGVTLKAYFDAMNGKLSLDEIISYTIQILKALRAVHDKKIIHRDIKPQNIMVLGDGKVKVMDFGIAKLPNTETVTATDKALGTVYYMSPEQAAGKGVDSRSDIYSLGAMLYELATGRFPFNGETPVSVLIKQINEDPIPPREINPDIPVGLEQIILCAMNKKPNERFQSAESMLKYMRELQNDNKIKFSTLPSQKVSKRIKVFFKKLFGKNK